MTRNSDLDRDPLPEVTSALPPVCYACGQRISGGLMWVAGHPIHLGCRLNRHSTLTAVEAQRDTLLKVLKELVACKDQFDRAANMNCKMRGRPGKVRAELLEDYERRLPLAWNAARAAIAAAEDSK